MDSSPRVAIGFTGLGVPVNALVIHKHGLRIAFEAVVATCDLQYYIHT